MRIALFGLLLSLPVWAETPADIVLKGEISHSDHQRYLEIPFLVPDGVSRLSVSFSHDGSEQRTTIDLGLADPARMRGWSGGNKLRFTLSETDATPSYLPGPIPAGRWRLVLGVPNIRPGVVTHYSAEIRFGPIEEAALKPGPAWFRGDLHMHTAHSDGSCRSQSGAKVHCPVFRIVQDADSRGLDFIAISDHNTVSQAEMIRELQPFFDRTLLIVARELTTFTGHANAFGTVAPIDFRTDANTMADAVHKSGGLFSLNHPNAPSGEACMGCGWEAKDFDFAKADGVEIVNGGALKAMAAYGEAALGIGFWHALLAKGYSPTALGGSDDHDADIPLDAPGSVGAPTTAVYASSLSAHDILAGIKAGHVFIDLAGRRNRLVELFAETAAGNAMMGDHVKLGDGAAIALHVAGLPDGKIAVIADGTPFTDKILEIPLSQDDRRSFRFAGDGRKHWVCVEIRDRDGTLALLSNPIYFD